MTKLLKRIWKDERGFVVSAELVLIATVGVLGMVVGISSIASSINNEMNDISNAFGALNQSYWHSGLVKVGHAGISGSAYGDRADYCDCSTIVRTVPNARFAPAPRLHHPHLGHRKLHKSRRKVIPRPHFVPRPKMHHPHKGDRKLRKSPPKGHRKIGNTPKSRKLPKKVDPRRPGNEGSDVRPKPPFRKPARPRSR